MTTSIKTSAEAHAHNSDITSALANKLRRVAALKQQTKIRSVKPASSITPIEYLISFSYQEPDAKEICGALIPVARPILIEKLLAQLNDAQADALQFTNCDQYLLIFVTGIGFPQIDGCVPLRAIKLAQDRQLLLPANLKFNWQLTEEDLQNIIDSNEQYNLIKVDSGKLQYWQISSTKLQPLANLFDISIQMQSASALLNKDELANYGASLNKISTPPLPTLQQIMQLGDNGTIALLPAPSRWMRIKSWYQRLFAQNSNANNIQSSQNQPVKVQVETETDDSATAQQNQHLFTKIINRLKNLFTNRALNSSLQQQRTVTITHKNKIDTTNVEPSSLRKRWDDLKADLTLKLLQTFPMITRRILREQTRHMLEMMSLFQQNKYEEAFRHAVPLAGEKTETSRGRIGLWWPKIRRNLEFKITDLFAKRYSSATVMPVGENNYDVLKKYYEDGAKKLLAQRNYRAAAYVYAQLLHDFAAAAQTLSMAGFHREAAVIYLEKLFNAPAAAEELAMAGDYQEAAKLMLSISQFKGALSYYRAAGDEINAHLVIEQWISTLIQHNHLIEAASVIANELADFSRATDLLIASYDKELSQKRVELGLQIIKLFLRGEMRNEAITFLARLKEDVRNRVVMGTLQSGPAITALYRYGEGLLELENAANKAGIAALNLTREAWRVLIETAVAFTKYGFKVQARRVTRSLNDFAKQQNDAFLLADIEQSLTKLDSIKPEKISITSTNNEPIILPKGGNIAATALHMLKNNLLLVGYGDGTIKVYPTNAALLTNKIDRPTINKSKIDSAAILNNSNSRLKASTLIGPCRYSATAISSNKSSTRIAILTVDGIVTIWSGSGQLTLDFRDPAAPYTALGPFIDEHQIILGTAKGGILIFNTENGKLISQIEQEGVIFTLAYHPRYKILACGGRTNLLQLYRYDNEQLKVMRSIPTEFGMVRTLSFQDNTNSCIIIFGGEQGGLAVIQLTGNDLMGKIERLRLKGHAHWVNTIAISSKRLIATAGYDHKIHLWQVDAEMTAGRYTTLIGHQNEITGLGFTSDGFLYSADTGGVVACWVAEDREYKLLEYKLIETGNMQ